MDRIREVLGDSPAAQANDRNNCSAGGPERTELSLSQKAIVVSLIRFSGQVKQKGRIDN